MDFISVGKNNKYVNTRCFVIVKKNGVIEDFSIQKCIEQIALKYCWLLIYIFFQLYIFKRTIINLIFFLNKFPLKKIKVKQKKN